MRHPLTAAAFAAAALLALSACSGSGSDDATTAGDGELALANADTLTVCTNPPFEPFEYEEDGQIVGLDMALTGEIAADLGVELRPLNTGFDAIESGAALNAQQCDIAASALTITDARKKNVDFSDAYFDADQGVLVASGSPVTDEAGLEGLKIGVQQATTGATWVEEQGLEGVQFEDLGLQIQSLRNGQVDVVVNDVTVLEPYATGDLEVAFVVPTGEQYGFAIRKGNTALVDAANATLERIRQDGTYDELVAEYFGTGEPTAEPTD
ncbi:transporter substrate-binding domain-containing protein [Cellulomonas dongxiuzhuiae]|uniref:Transporter substrate-binding domain-containing protein n=1 Tax=Cellulomonas dongxiuzhuiae TaxID=2819979 RepID=A0ABX8GN19_9CELL|nr:transporter substrate-binding domain-containing protein [Cellulomonas dongxiuzhuiae]MBO3096015.1 transporter substrate-binding domain-containing protein [Cellulomonas dongxiuzhuiae]QWC17297.1 transporter substrate-binding domain-containing protein [Cellulomonas dongxiuzhuiae]